MCVCVSMYLWLCVCARVGANKQAQTCSSLSTSNLPTVCCLLTAQQQEEREAEGQRKGQSERQRKEETNKPAKMTLSDPKCQPSLLCDCQIGSTYNAVAAAAPPYSRHAPSSNWTRQVAAAVAAAAHMLHKCAIHTDTHTLADRQWKQTNRNIFSVITN